MTTLGLPGRFGLVWPGGAADCVRLYVWPAIDRTAVRVDVVVLAAAVSVTTPLPAPPSGLIVSQVGPVPTVQPHPAAPVTFTVTFPPFPGTVADPGEIANAQPGAAACVTVTACPAIVNVVLRLTPSVFAAAVSVTVPLPVPLAGLTESQDDAETVLDDVEVVLDDEEVPPDDTVQPQPAAVVTFSWALPPPAPIDAAEGATA